MSERGDAETFAGCLFVVFWIALFVVMFGASSGRRNVGRWARMLWNDVHAGWTDVRPPARAVPEAKP